ncbi:MAG: alpha/beta hydrolase [Acidobacteriota bacterium]|jgi:acetyl esterase/lipase|nr:alpha/beta hydrolase [Acidobacteriota bacterium]NLT32645.1 alpha/beta hydrolase [Acidobacteriota bacterium]
MADAAEIVVERDAVYAEVGRPLRWNVFRPAAAVAGAPGILVYHGGGWRVGDRANMTAACEAFARRGWVAIAPEYRLLGEAPWPAPLDDTRAAIRAAREQAGALGIAADRVFLAGYSAGAHLALLAASGSEDPAQGPCADRPGTVAGVAAFFVPAVIPETQGSALGITGPCAAAALDLRTHAGRLPPVILFCGDGDSMTPPELSLELYQAIRRAGGTADLRLYADLVHEFVSLPGMMEATVDDAAAFFTRTVLCKAEFDAALERLRRWWEGVG